MFSNNPSFNNNIMWSILAALIASAIMLIMPTMVFAATPTATDTGFGAAAYEVYDIIDGFGGTLIALLGGAISLSTLIRGWNLPVFASGIGVAAAAKLAPDIVVTLSGGAVIL